LTEGRIEEARKLIETTVRLEPKNPAVHINLGAYWVRAGAPQEAIRHFERTLQLNPRAAGAHRELGQIFLSAGRLEEGRRHYELRARLAQWDAEAQWYYGVLLTELRRPREAIPYLKRALWIRPDLAVYRGSLAAARAQVDSAAPEIRPP
jgi:tetratricopeptide (TPR) repeat protein